VVAYIEENLSQALTLDELASVACLSRFHFAGVFRLETGLAPHAFVTARRVAQAERLLSRTRLSTAEIARRVGFSDTARMTEAFRRTTGRSTREVRTGPRCRWS
jgi:AraC family transcriptional regulator